MIDDDITAAAGALHSLSSFSLFDMWVALNTVTIKNFFGYILNREFQALVV